ncbi:MAG: hypothetical protein JXQ75_20385 [Phycisphaerae bacterium]|nr:hypothetical protein [Phycisphaerae bacterium]
MKKATLLQEIEELEALLQQTKAKKPLHDTAGTHDAMVLEIEDELADKRKAFARIDQGES